VQRSTVISYTVGSVWPLLPCHPQTAQTHDADSNTFPDLDISRCRAAALGKRRGGVLVGGHRSTRPARRAAAHGRQAS